MNLIKRAWWDESGVALNEYALLLIAILAILIAAVVGFSSRLGEAFSASGNSATRL
jgi:Flp pilus assembly pilin Flp